MASDADYLQIRGFIVHFHALVDDEGVYLIDSGFLGARGRLRRKLASIGRSMKDVRAILLTHGHLDHTLNAAAMAEESGAKVICPRLDARHLDGSYPYRGITRACGWAEAAGRAVFRYRVPKVDQWIDPGDELPFWGGLQVIGLPGHTLGHVGFYSPSRELLFSGDLFSNYLGLGRRPPPWFNVDPKTINASIHTALDIPLKGVQPNHCHPGSPASQLRALRGLGRRLS